MKRIFNVAHIGCGSVSDNHLTALSHIENVKVVALCDTVRERAEAKNEKYGFGAEIYTDYKEMLAEVRPDAVHIATPHYLHAEMTVAALELGIYVFTEKPIAINEEQVERMIEAERNSTARACVCFQNRFCPAILKAKEIVAADGGATSAYGSLFWERDEKYYTESGWRGSFATEGGGVMINQAIHTIDLICEFLGKPKTLVASVTNRHLKGIIEVEDTADGIIHFENGTQGNFYATTSFLGAASTTFFAVTKNHKVEMRLYDLYVDGERIDVEDHKNFVGKYCYGNGHEVLIKRFYEAIERGDDEMPVTLESAKWALRILLAAYRSNNELVEV